MIRKLIWVHLFKFLLDLIARWFALDCFSVLVHVTNSAEYFRLYLVHIDEGFLCTSSHLLCCVVLGFLLLARVIAVTFCVTLSASMAARRGSIQMAAFQICLQVWLATSLLADGLAVAGQVSVDFLVLRVWCLYLR
jgi:Na+-driven multidrug efflux pump